MLARPVGWTILALAALLAWDASGLDIAAAQWWGTSAGFPLRDNWFLVHVMHIGARNLSWVLVIALFFAIRWPVGFLRRLSMGERAQLAGTVLASVIVVSLIKTSSHTSCPWDLNLFGGVAHYVSHWSWGELDGGPGGCFPAGHASAAFAYVGGYFVLRRSMPSLARWWLLAAIVAGFTLGLVQQARGAHYMSHTLWTGWLCWTTGWLIDCAISVPNAIRAHRAGDPVFFSVRKPHHST